LDLGLDDRLTRGVFDRNPAADLGAAFTGGRGEALAKKKGKEKGKMEEFPRDCSRLALRTNRAPVFVGTGTSPSDALAEIWPQSW
jgi:hypothetical protein